MTSLAWPRVEGVANAVLRFVFIALGITIPISVAVDSVFVAILVVCWLAAGKLTDTWKTIRSDAVAALAALWFVAHVLGALYSIGDRAEVIPSIVKAGTFMLIPIAMASLTEQRIRQRALHALMASIGITLILSWMLWLGVLPENALLKGTRIAPHVFKNHITHNLLMAFGAFVFAVQAIRATSRRNRILLRVVAALAAFNVLYMVEGRTGQLVLLVLIVYYGIWRMGRRGVIAAVALSLLAATGAYLMPQSSLHTRAARAVAEAQDWKPGALATTSMSHRLEFYRNTLPIVAEHPLLGVGTGGFVAAYARRVSGTESAVSHNPHNQYLFTAVQLGLPGVALLLSIFWLWWRRAPRLDDPYNAVIMRALVITYVVASMVSSTFSDHTETLLFVWASGVLFAGQRDPDPDIAPAHVTRHAAGLPT